MTKAFAFYTYMEATDANLTSSTKTALYCTKDFFSKCDQMAVCVATLLKSHFRMGVLL